MRGPSCDEHIHERLFPPFSLCSDTMGKELVSFFPSHNDEDGSHDRKLLVCVVVVMEESRI